MKNNYSIAQRNAIVEDHLWCIDSIIQKNRPLMRAARLEYDDVYQQLAIRLIKAVAGYAHGDGQGHTPGRVSNKTLYIALNYKEQAERLNTEAAETIAAELFVLEHEHERLKLYISLIDKREAEVLMLLYSEKESAVNVAERLGYSKRTITRIHNAAVAHLAEMYEYAEKYDG